MVKVVEKTLEERAREEEISTLVKVTDELLGQGSTKENYTGGFYIPKYVGDLYFGFLGVRKIRVSEEKYFDTAIKLAEAYEKATGNEWTVKKDY